MAIGFPEFQVGLRMDMLATEASSFAIMAAFKLSLRDHVITLVGPVDQKPREWADYGLTPPRKWSECTVAKAKEAFSAFYASDGSQPAGLSAEGDPPPICRMTPQGWIKEYTFHLSTNGGVVDCDAMVDKFKTAAGVSLPPRAEAGLRTLPLYLVIHFEVPYVDVRDAFA